MSVKVSEPERESHQHVGCRKATYVLSFVMLLGCLSAYYRASDNPPGFYLDESSIAYNAYTIAEYGHDEYGEPWPLYFRAFGEYKNPVYIYALATIFRIFGPSILAARLLSVTVGIAAVLTLSFLALKISRQSLIAALVGLSAVFTPWLFENSRLVFEVALYPLLICLFLLAVFSASRNEHWNWLHSISLATTLALLTYAYSIGRLFGPLLALGLIVFGTRKRFRALLITWFLYALMMVPAFVFHLRHPGALMSRFWLLTYLNRDGSIGEIIIAFVRQFAANINPWTIAVTGESNVRDHVGTMGAILFPTLLMSVLGLALVLLYFRRDRWWRFMCYALVVCVIPASLTTTRFPQIRLVAMPVLLHVFMIPALIWFTTKATPPFIQYLKRAALVAFVLIVVIQGLIFRIQFEQAAKERWYVFDLQFPAEVLPTALAQQRVPIYLHDPPGKSGYVQAYWHGMLQGLPDTQFLRITEDQQVENGSVVISTAEYCFDCRMLLKSINYIVYVVDRRGIDQRSNMKQ